MGGKQCVQKRLVGFDTVQGIEHPVHIAVIEHPQRLSFPHKVIARYRHQRLIVRLLCMLDKCRSHAGKIDVFNIPEHHRQNA